MGIETDGITRDGAGATVTRTPETTKGGLSASAESGTLRRVSDGRRGLWIKTPSQWAPVRGGVYDAAEFGVTADGSTDDTTALQDLIDLVKSSNFGEGGIIKLPGGDIRTTSTLTIDDDTVFLVGQGPSATRIVADGVTGSVLEIAGTKANPLRLHAIIGMDLVGDTAAGTTYGLDARYSVHEELTVHRVRAYKNANAQIRLDNCWGADVTNIVCGGFNVGTYGLRALNANVVRMNGVWVNNIADINSTGIRIDGATGCSLENATVENCADGIQLEPNLGGGNEADSFLIQDLNVEKLKNAKNVAKLGVAGNGTVFGVTLQNCTLKGTKILIDDAEDVKLENIRSNPSSSIHIETTANAVNVRAEGLLPEIVLVEATDIRLLDKPSIWIPAKDFGAAEGIPTLGLHGASPDQYLAYALSNTGSKEAIIATVVMPKNFGEATVQPHLYWASPNTSTEQTAALSASATAIGKGSAADSQNLNTGTFEDSTTAHGVNKPARKKWQATLPNGREIVNLIVRRSSGNADDDLTNDANIIGVELRIV